MRRLYAAAAPLLILAATLLLDVPAPVVDPFAAYASVMPGNARENALKLAGVTVTQEYLPCCYGPEEERNYFTYTLTPHSGGLFTKMTVSGWDGAIRGVTFQVAGEVLLGDLVGLFGRPDRQRVLQTRANFAWEEAGVYAYTYYEYMGAGPRQIMRIELEYVGFYK